MPRDSFPDGVAEQLKWYVYRLIDPRNGETFYVGKGKDNRIFHHARGESANTITQEQISRGEEEKEDDIDLKLQRIKDIKVAGLEVGHVIHRYGIDNPRVAYEIEAALIDAYPGLTNKVKGKGSRSFGLRHVEEIIREYAAEPFVIGERLMLIFIGTYFHSSNVSGVYDAVRCAWPVNRDRAEKYKLVLAHMGGLVRGAYRPTGKWLPATPENFPGLVKEGDFINPLTNMPTRWGFIGETADDVWDQYVGKSVPERYRKRGARAPFRYCHPDDA